MKRCWRGAGLTSAWHCAASASQVGTPSPSRLAPTDPPQPSPAQTPTPPATYLCTTVYSNIHTHTSNGPFSRTTRVSRYQKGKTNLDFTEARDSEWQWHQLGHMQVCTLLQTDNHTSNPPLSFLQARCPSCHPTNSVKALKG